MARFFEDHQLGIHLASILFGIAVAFLLPVEKIGASVINIILPILLFVVFLNISITKNKIWKKNIKFTGVLLVGNIVFVSLCIVLMFILLYIFLSQCEIYGIYPMDEQSSAEYVHGLEGIELVLGKMIETVLLFLFIPCADYFVGFYRKTIREAELLAATQSLLLIVVYGVFIYLLSNTISSGHSPADDYEPLPAYLIRVFFYMFLPLILAWYLQVAAKYNSFIQYPTTIIKDSLNFIKPFVLFIIAAYGCSTILSEMHLHYYFFDEIKETMILYDRYSYNEGDIQKLRIMILVNLREFVVVVSIFYLFYLVFSVFVSRYIARFCDLDFEQTKALTYSMCNRASIIVFAWSFIAAKSSDKGAVTTTFLMFICFELARNIFCIYLVPYFGKTGQKAKKLILKVKLPKRNRRGSLT